MTEGDISNLNGFKVHYVYACIQVTLFYIMIVLNAHRRRHPADGALLLFVLTQKVTKKVKANPNPPGVLPGHLLPL